ncbi:dimethylamine monooxygenase subunit DmmA family protein [Xanthobacter sp. TB0139]|uniref:dimethylamine monooxygenase subunit DmmA family protein n=1 Tax=Xanthobacter sp. TB0139 TaxID=3459178 RepID=UPI00403951B2
MTLIKSRPLYGRLQPVLQAGCHITLAEGCGIEAVEGAFSGQREVLERTIMIGIARPDDAAALVRLEGLGADALHVRPTRETAFVKLRAVLAGAGMASRLYLAGPEDFIGQALAIALAAGLEGDAIQMEHRGNSARRVQCVHCKGFMDEVTESPVTCVHCGTHLLVRDHYSRRLGAFMGVVIDAEAPGDLPPAEVLPNVECRA